LPEFKLFQIQTGSVVLEGAALSPDGEQLAAAYFGGASASATDDVVLKVTLWTVERLCAVLRSWFSLSGIGEPFGRTDV
jgi:hypothetical protein